MAKFDYSKARLVAENLIDKFGDSGEFVIKGNDGGFDQSGNPIPPEPDVIFSGIVTPLLKYKQHEIDGEKIKATDSFVFFHSEDEPQIDSAIIMGGVEYLAKDIQKLDSVSGINVYRKIQLRVS